jgi:hypothetical protein
MSARMAFEDARRAAVIDPRAQWLTCFPGGAP